MRIFRTAMVFRMVAALTGPLAQAQTDRAQSEVALRQMEQKLVRIEKRLAILDQVVAPEWTVSISLAARVTSRPSWRC